MSIFANLLVWILGCAISYWVHDPDPTFALAKKRVDRAKRIYRKLHAPLEAKIRAQEADRDRKLRELENKISAEADSFADLRNKIDQMNQREEDFIKSLTQKAQAQVEDYLHFLCSEALANNKKLTVNKNGKVLPISEYQHESITVSPEIFRRAVS